MKKTDFSVSLRDGVFKRLKQYSRLLSQSLTASLLLLAVLYQTPLTGQSNCSLSCQGAQISLGLDCTAEVTTAMIADTSDCVGGDFTVYVYTLAGDTLPGAIVGFEQINMTLIASIHDNNSGNSCWTYITVQDKMKPTIVCADDTISCLDMLNYNGPEVFDNCPAVAMNQINTINLGGNVNSPNGAVYFEINNTSGLPITVLEIGLNLEMGTMIDIYRKPGTYVGATQNPSLWNWVGTADATVGPFSGPFPGNGTITPAPTQFTVPPGLWAFAIHALSSSQIYTNGNGGNQSFSDANITINCGQAANTLWGPIFSPRVFNGHFKYGFSQVDLILLNEEAELLCDPNLIKRITRTYQARDASGNLSEPCQMNIYLERIDFADITFPDSLTVAGGDPLDCAGGWADADGDGIPDPLSDGVYPGTGVPTIDGTPIYPDFIGFCNALTTYEDLVLPAIGCVRKVMRVWTVREWHCQGETDTLYIQLIEIVDDEGPSITCPADFSHTTNGHLCTATVWIPAAVVSDNCSDVVSVTVAYPGGFQNQNGGFYATLPVGANVLTYTAYDECYNSSQCTMTIHVMDETPPIPVCDEHTIVSLTLGGPHGLTKVDASVFDDGSYDACGPVTFLAHRMDSCIDFDWTTGGAGEDEIPDGDVDSRDRGTVPRTKVPFACCDAGAGPIMIVLTVIDASGNQNTCMVEVQVQDKIPPQLTCPSNVTISCDYPLDINNLDAFGSIVADPHDVQEWCVYDPTNPYANPDGFVCGVDGVVTDNCDVTITVTTHPNINNCGVGYIRRQWVAADANGSRSCNQYIYIQNFDPVNGDNIIWPLDYHGVECAEGTDPDELPAPYNEPVIDEDACDLVGVTYEDVVFPIVDGACFKILRTWKVIEWCLYEEVGYIQEGYNYWEHVQILKVVNQFGPEFLTDQPTIDRCNDFDCNGLFLELIQRAEDDCTPSNLLMWSYAVDANNDGTIDIGPFTGLGGEINASGTYPLGNHRIIYSFEDRCGNRTVAEQLINLESCKAPVPVCINGLSTNLMAVDTDGDGIEDTGMITIWASDFDASSYHPCGRPFTLSLSPDINVTSITFDCSHVGAGQVPVNLYVTDELGNQAYCETYIIVTDNNNVCNGGGTLTGTITGNVSTETSENVLDVTVELGGTTMLPLQTNQTGMYTFPSMPVGGTYEVLPGKNNDYKNGVSTLDLLQIQKHLLGIQLLDSPYKLIAADANNSESITAIDLIELRKLILGLYNELPNNESWRFVDKTYVFPDPNNPWMQAWPESRVLNPLSAGMNQADFRGIKVGDVNNSVKANAQSVTPRGSGAILDLVIDEKVISSGQLVEVPVYAGTARNLEGMQWTFRMANGLQWVDVQNGQIELDSDNFGWLDNNTLTASWHNTTAVNADPAQPLFTLVFKAGQSGRLSQAISLGTAPTQPEAYADGDILDLAISFRGAEDSFVFELMQNEPNPFNGITRIGYVIPESGEVMLTLFDMTGRQLLSRTLAGTKGMNQVEISRDQINGQGMIYYQIQFQGYTATKKMMIL